MQLVNVGKNVVSDLVATAKSAAAETGTSRKVFMAEVLVVATAASVIFFEALGRFPLFDPDEAYYAEHAREMLVTGEYVTSMLNYVVSYTKPPLTLWAMALSYRLFGVSEFTTRFYAATCATILIVCTYIFCRRYAGRRIAVIAALLLSTSPVFIATGREAITDMPLSLFMACSLMAFFHSFKQKAIGWLVLAYVLTGLAVMTKGPVAVVLVALILLSYHALRDELKVAFRHYRLLLGAVIVALIALPWFALEIYCTHGDYFKRFILYENLQRFVSVVDHKAPWWYHFAVVMAGLAPWSIFLFPALRMAFNRSATAKGNAVTSAGTSAEPAKATGSKPIWPVGLYKNVGTNQDLMLFCGISTLVVVGFFSLAVTKLATYTLPVYPAMAMLIAAAIIRLVDEKRRRVFAIFFALIALSLLAAVAVAHAIGNRQWNCPPELLPLLPVILCTLAAGAFISCILSARTRLMAAVTVFGITVAGAIVFFGPQLVAICTSEWEQPVVDFARIAGPSGKAILVYKIRKLSLIFYAKRQILVPGSSDELTSCLRSHPHAFIFARTQDEKELTDRPGVTVVEKRKRYILLSWSDPKWHGADNTPPVVAGDPVRAH